MAAVPALDHLDWVRAMRTGDYELAWAIGAALDAARDPATRDDPTQPYHKRWVWDGADLRGRHVLVRCYHGLGDTIQFLRYLPHLRRIAASVTLEVPPRLRPLIDGAALADTIVPFDAAAPLRRQDCDIEIMELAQALRLPPAAAPPPYLACTPSALPAGTIGLCCTAGDWDDARSFAPDLLGPLCAGRSCVSLDPQPSALPVLNPTGCPFDMAQTARLVAGVSLVITVDTMIAHLAGAMNKPTWLLLKHEPDWRWTPGADGSAWYPSMRLFHQPSPGDWPSVVARVAAELDVCNPAGSASAQ